MLVEARRSGGNREVWGASVCDRFEERKRGVGLRWEENRNRRGILRFFWGKGFLAFGFLRLVFVGLVIFWAMEVARLGQDNW